MRYQDFKHALDDALAKERRLHKEAEPLIDQRLALEEKSNRRYEVTGGVVVSFNAAGAAVGYQNHGIYILDAHGAFGPPPSSVWLAAAAPVVRHIERWIAGEIDELAPSGPWVDPAELESLPRAAPSHDPDALRILAEVFVYLRQIKKGNELQGPDAETATIWLAGLVRVCPDVVGAAHRLTQAMNAEIEARLAKEPPR